MKILIYEWQAYNYRDIIFAFQKMGHETSSFHYHLTNYDENDDFMEHLERKLAEKQFDFVFSMNYFPVVAIVCHEKKVPYVCWICDSPLIAMHHNSVFYPENFFFDFDLASMRLFQEMGVEHIHHLPLAVDVDRMDNVLAKAGDLANYQNDISFVGNLYERNSYDRLEPNLPDYLRGYFEAAMEIQCNTYGGNVLEDALTADILERLSEFFVLEKSKDSFSDLGLVFSTTVLGFKVARMQRIRAIRKLGRSFDFGLYTESSTRGLPGVVSKGGLDYWGELPKLFHQSKINLNLTIPNIHSGIPLRMWDVLGAGGFLLTNYQAETTMYLDEGKDLVSFYDMTDMEEKASFYLSHDDERQKIAVHGRETVRAKHTYFHRLEEMLRILKEYGI